MLNVFMDVWHHNFLLTPSLYSLLSISLSPFLAHTHTHTHIHTDRHTHALSLSLSLSQTHTLSVTHPLTHFPCNTTSLILTPYFSFFNLFFFLFTSKPFSFCELSNCFQHNLSQYITNSLSLSLASPSYSLSRSLSRSPTNILSLRSPPIIITLKMSVRIKVNDAEPKTFSSSSKSFSFISISIWSKRRITSKPTSGGSSTTQMRARELMGGKVASTGLSLSRQG